MGIWAWIQDRGKGRLTFVFDFLFRTVLLQALVVESRIENTDAFASTAVARESLNPQAQAPLGGASDAQLENGEY